jgi:hypothetical protein
MNDKYGLSIHTMDLPPIGAGPVELQWQLITMPKGTKGMRSSKHGYVGMIPLIDALEPPAKIIEKQITVGGMNDAGLTCGAQVLHSEYPKKKDHIYEANIPTI